MLVHCCGVCEYLAFICGGLPWFCSLVMDSTCRAYRSAFLLQEYEFDLEVTPADAEGGEAEAMEEA